MIDLDGLLAGFEGYPDQHWIAEGDFLEVGTLRELCAELKAARAKPDLQPQAVYTMADLKNEEARETYLENTRGGT